MEATPPDYQTATRVDYWDLVARYLPSSNLCSAALVCSRWHAAFAPHLWGNPASHFGIENDAVYVALTRFKRTLRTARLLVRSMTHTLLLPPAHAELYYGPQADWLRDLFDRLPNLQSLIVRGLPFFDYAALQALNLLRKKAQDARVRPESIHELSGSASSSPSRPVNHIPSFNLRLLDASRCPNVTPNSLAVALSRFNSLLYLDLSFTYAARDHSVLDGLHNFSGLQVLKLRGINLRDDSIEVLCKSIGRRVRSLDVRENHLTDGSIRLLLDNCFTARVGASAMTTCGPHSPTLLPHLGSRMLDIYRGEDFEAYLRNAFTGHFVDRLAIEDTPATGVTHLYIAGNSLTLEGVSGLVRSGRLHVLDVGSIAAAHTRHRPASDGETQDKDSDVAGTENLGPVFSKHAADALTFLRIGHGIVTREAAHRASERVVPNRFGLADSPPLPSPKVAELGGKSTSVDAHEMSTDSQTSRSKLQGQVTKSPTTATFDGPPSYSSTVTERNARLSAHIATCHNFHPAMLPHVSTLVLTDVPPYSQNHDVADRIIRFVKHCADEAAYARSQARLDYTLPPGRRSYLDALESSQTAIFALKRLVLELAPTYEPRSKAASTWQQRTREPASMDDDRDVGSLWASAVNDFSFFGEEENMFPTNDDDRPETAVATGKEVKFGPLSPKSVASAPVQASVDNIALISAFRKDRKLAYERSVAAGVLEPQVDGLWTGVVQVVRSNATLRSDEQMDYYGNKFINQYLYR